ncbi:MAG: mannitol dehydrogenase [Caulobacteraceae bacterium]|nr:mannitol dehydrogenase [Caulobacteraceae bacterium]
MAALPADVVRPAYDRSEIVCGVVHLGVGAFHRAHQAVVFDDVLGAGDRRWGIRGVSLRSADVRNRLQPQHGLYGLETRGAGQSSLRIIGALREVVTAPEAPSGVAERLADPAVHLVTLTITEKGYHLDPATGEPLWDSPELRHDIEQPQAPVTAAGLLTAGLERRRERGLAGLSALSCDNLPHNGSALRRAVLGLAERRDPRLRDWIEANAAFPESMVDRIVPATTQGDIDGFADRTGVLDAGLVVTEPFLQWVLQDRFAGPRPDLARAGVQLVASVGPFETAKLRMLNGAHSAIAYLGGLAGLDYVHDFVGRKPGQAYIQRLWDEIGPTLPAAPGLDLDWYRRALAGRFLNPALKHRTRQIAMDGSQKLPQRLLAPLQARLARGVAAPALILAVAAWMRWQSGRDDAGDAIPPDDPRSPALRRAYAQAGSPRARVEALTATEVFGGALRADPQLLDQLAAALERLERIGAAAALDEATG